MHWNLNLRTGFTAAILAATMLSFGLSGTASAQGRGKKTYPSKRFEEARAVAEKKDMPIAVTWSDGSGENMSYKKSSKYGPKFVWVHLNTKKDAATLRQLGKDAYFTYGKMRSNEDGKNHKTSGYIFMNADGVIYSRLPRVMDRGIDRMLVAVCRRHYGYADFYGTSIFNGRPNPRAMPGKIKILPTPKNIHVWKDCPQCKKFIRKAMPYIRSKYPGNWYGGMLGSWTCVPAMMMYGKDDKLLKQHFEDRAGHYIKCAPTVFGGYMNWFLAGTSMSMSEYALRYGLTPKLKTMMEKTHQDASEYIDECLGWFHHPRKGGKNYSWEQGMIGCLYQAAFAEMDYMGITVEPGLSLARAACNRGSYGSVGGPGKNGMVVAGMYAAGRADDAFTRHWAKWQWGGREPEQRHNPEGGIYPQQQHAYANWHWMGAAVGLHRMGPAHYDNWATEWIHALIKLQLADGSVPQLQNDTSEGKEDPMDYVKHVKAQEGAGKGNWEATGVVASMVLMSEPGAFYGVPIKPKGSLPNAEAYKKANKYFNQKRYAEAYPLFSVVLPPGEALHLVPSARLKMRVCEEHLCLDLGKRKKIALAIAKYPAETRAQAGVQLYGSIGSQGPVIVSINSDKLSTDARAAYGMIQKGDYATGLSKIKECEAEATEYDKRSIRTMKKYIQDDVNNHLKRIAAVTRSQDVYQLYNAVAAADKTCKGVESYEKELSAIRTQLARPESLKLKVVGEEYNKLVDSSKMRLLDYLTKLEEFAARNPKSVYGIKASEEIATYQADINTAVAEVNGLLQKGDAYAAKGKMAKCEKKYGKYSFFEERAAPLREALQSKKTLELIKVGRKYQYFLNDKTASSKPGIYIKTLSTFVEKNAGTYYGGLASELMKEAIAEMDDRVKTIVELHASGDVYKADWKLKRSDKAYNGNKSYLEKTAELRKILKTDESRKQISIGRMYYMTIRQKPGKKKDKMVEFFKKKYGTTYYGKLLEK